MVQGELVQCGLTESETCLKSVTLGLSGGANVSMKHTEKRSKTQLKQCMHIFRGQSSKIMDISLFNNLCIFLFSFSSEV